jgi:hypothetical protein
MATRRGRYVVLLAYWLLWYLSPTSHGIQGPFPTQAACEKISEAWLFYMTKKVVVREMPQFSCVSDAK